MSRRPARPSRFDLYEWCVQAPEVQARFVRALHGGRTRSLCEDFCGPASIARAWAMLDADHDAAGIDRDAEPLAHARRRALEAGIAARSFAVVRGDVRECRRRADAIVAFNFAVCELHERRGLVACLRNARRRLRRGGIFVCDTYGGAGSFVPCRTSVRVPTPVGLVTYTWEQRRADPLAARVENAMHFRLPGGRTMRDAFVYDWRLWSVAELGDAMRDAGFASSEVHLSYGAAMDGRGDPVPEPAALGTKIEGDFVAYVVGRTARRPSSR